MKEHVYGLFAFAEERRVGHHYEKSTPFARGTHGVITELYNDRPGARWASLRLPWPGDKEAERQLEVGRPKQPVRSPQLSLVFEAGFAEIGPRLKLPLHGLVQSNSVGRLRLNPRPRRALCRWRRVHVLQELHERRLTRARFRTLNFAVLGLTRPQLEERLLGSLSRAHVESESSNEPSDRTQDAVLEGTRMDEAFAALDAQTDEAFQGEWL